MGDNVTVNGLKVSWGQIIPILMFTFWLGTLSIMVTSNAQDQKDHAGKPAHEAAALATNTLQADVKYNTAEIEKLNKKLDSIDKKIDENQKEVLEAIREE